MIAHYRITAKLGEGGMGEVYRATDTKLGRDVAVKVIPPAFAQDADRMARFTREAQVLASLNHPNIAAIYGVEDRALIMELVEGESLRGPLPVDTAMQYAHQIADALEAAHEKGIIHRDLKPANIQVTPQGVVKVLDFGLATVTHALSSVSSDPAHSPTVTIGATRAGAIMGTAAYMSPEQARGRVLDKRTDIWAFGCVLYEMLTGRPAFGGESVTDVLAAVVKSEPDWAALPPGSPVHLLRRCLEKDPKRRLRDIGDAFAEPESAAPVEHVRSPLRQDWLVAVLLCLLIASSGVALFLWTRWSSPSKAVLRLSIALPANQELTDHPAISPDGQIVAYSAREGSGEPRLYLRGLNSFEVREVPGSNGATQPFFSPDGRWVAFFAQGQLQKAAIDGGAPVRLARATFPFGGTWNEDHTIVYVPENVSGLWRIPAAGGKPEPITRPDGGANGFAHVWPQSLPGTRAVLFTVWGKGVIGSAVLSLGTLQWQHVLPGAGGTVFAPSSGSLGWLLASDLTAGLKAALLDAAHPARTAADTPVLTDVFYRAEGLRTWLAVSRTGTAVYIPGNPAKRSLAWVDRAGNLELASKEQGAYWQCVLSPDGSKALTVRGADLWVHDLSTGGRRRVTFNGDNGAIVSSPMWSRDGKRIFFSSNEGGDIDIYSQPADGSRPAEVFLKRPDDQYPTSMAPDGTLLFGEGYPNRGEALFTLSPDGRVAPLRVTPFTAVNALFSPDGRWVAYQSDESGRFEIYAEAWPGGGKHSVVSTEGGITPAWSRDGKELFYVAGDAVMAVPLRPDGSFGAGRKLFDRSGFYFLWHSYDAAPDGKRFLMIHRDAGSVPRQLNVILNWSAELQRLVPPGKK